MTADTITRPVAAPRAVAGIDYGTLLRVEWRKATDTRSARWLIGITAVATVLIALAPILAQHKIDQDWLGYMDLIGVPVGLLLPVVAIMTVTTEWSQRTVLTTFTQEPRRLRVLGAKLVVTLLMGVVAAVFVGVVNLAALAVGDGTGLPVTSMHAGGAVLVGLLLNMFLNLLLGAAFGAALQNTPAAIVLSFVVPAVLGGFGAAFHVVRDWFDPSTTFNWVLRGEFDGHVGGIVVSALVWIVAPLVIGAIRTQRREVK